MAMRGSLKVGRVLGIPIYIHLTFLLILPIFALAFGFSNGVILGFTLGFGGLPIDDVGKLILGLVSAIFFFISVLLHELAHSYIALKKGYKISSITLFFFGGLSAIENAPKEAKGEGLMAFVGPATSFLIGLVLLPGWLLFKDVLGLGFQILAIFFGLMSFYNILLGAFNIIPAFPLDGGRILRAGLVKRLGFLRATEVAVQVGKALALIMGLFGVVIFNPWLILIAFFLYIGAGEEERSTKLSVTLEGVKVGDIMTKEVSTVSSEASVKSLLNRMMTEKHLGYPVLESGKLVGIVTLQDVQRVPSEQQDMVKVGQIMSKNIVSVRPDTLAMDAIQLVSTKNIGRLLVLDDGRLVGILSRTDLIRVLEIRQSGSSMANVPP